MKKCDVSVIIPTYNRGNLLPRAIKSVMRQTYSCNELIVVDDGSTDNTEELLADIQTESYLPIQVIHQENSGPAAARNKGIMQARSKYIAFLDSDDHWQKKKLEVQYLALRNSGKYKISHTKEKWLRRGEHLNQKKNHIPQNGDIYDHCLQLCAVGMSTVMMAKELYEDVGFFDESMPCCEDYDFWLRVSCKYRFLLIDKQLTVKEGGRPDQVSQIYRVGMDQFRIGSLQKMLDSGLLNRNQYLLTFEQFKRKSKIYGQGCCKHGKVDKGLPYLEKLKDYERKMKKKLEIGFVAPEGSKK